MTISRAATHTREMGIVREVWLGPLKRVVIPESQVSTQVKGAIATQRGLRDFRRVRGRNDKLSFLENGSNFAVK